MAEQRRNALNDLVREHVGRGRRMTVRELADRAADPATGYQPSPSLVGKIIADQAYKISPELVSALAVGLGLARRQVAEAAHSQFVGDFDLIEPPAAADAPGADVRTASRPGTDPEQLTQTDAWVRAVARRRGRGPEAPPGDQNQ